MTTSALSTATLGRSPGWTCSACDAGYYPAESMLAEDQVTHVRANRINGAIKAALPR